MKSNYKDHCKYSISRSELTEIIESEVNKKLDDIFLDVCKQILPQYLAIALFELNTEFGFGKERLNRFKNGIDAYMEISRTDGFCGKAFDAFKVMEELKRRYGIEIKDIDITIKNLENKD